MMRIAPRTCLLTICATLPLAGCLTPTDSEHADLLYDGPALHERWNSIADPEKAPDYYGLTPGQSWPATPAATTAPPPQRTPTGN